MAAKYTRIVAKDQPLEFCPVLKVGVQYFHLPSAGSAMHAGWHCWMLAKALRRVVEQEGQGEL
jgi:hypothetical protein